MESKESGLKMEMSKGGVREIKQSINEMSGIMQQLRLMSAQVEKIGSRDLEYKQRLERRSEMHRSGEKQLFEETESKDEDRRRTSYLEKQSKFEIENEFARRAIEALEAKYEKLLANLATKEKKNRKQAKHIEQLQEQNNDQAKRIKELEEQLGAANQRGKELEADNHAKEEAFNTIKSRFEQHCAQTHHTTGTRETGHNLNEAFDNLEPENSTPPSSTRPTKPQAVENIDPNTERHHDQSQKIAHKLVVDTTMKPKMKAKTPSKLLGAVTMNSAYQIGSASPRNNFQRRQRSLTMESGGTTRSATTPTTPGTTSSVSPKFQTDILEMTAWKERERRKLEKEKQRQAAIAAAQAEELRKRQRIRNKARKVAKKVKQQQEAENRVAREAVASTSQTHKKPK